MRRETSRVSFLMCPFCVRALLTSPTTGPPTAKMERRTRSRGRFPVTAATGLEPATSGVTGRYGCNPLRRDRPVRVQPATVGYDRELLATAGISQPSEPAVTGYDRLPPGTACVVRVWVAMMSMWTTVT
jgi:hypothetical protein